MANVELCTFSLGDDVYCVDVHGVQEVLEPQEITPVPLAAPWVAGVVNLRGQLLPVLDLRTMLGLEPSPEGPSEAMHLVLRASTGNVSVLVDVIGDVVVQDDSRCEPAPPTVEGPGAALVRGAYGMESSLLVVLDHEMLAAPRLIASLRRLRSAASSLFARRLTLTLAAHPRS